MSSRGFVLIGSLVLLSAACSHKFVPQVGGSESHWLAECSSSVDCGDALDCICGACTRLCSVDSACVGELPAACYDRGSPALVRRCEGEGEPSAGVCLRECLYPSDCPGSLACIEGACVPRIESVPEPLPDSGMLDGGANPLDERDEPLPIDFSTPVSTPPLTSGVINGDERITGTWIEENCDPAEPSPDPPGGCVRLTLAREGTGEITGTIQIDRTVSVEGLLDPSPSYPPAENPDVGYPVGMEPRLYAQHIRTIPAGIPYRVLDGQYDVGEAHQDRLTFAWSTMDLWNDWCALQTSHRWTIGDHAFAFCVPQDRAQWSAIDEGKIALCTSAELEPRCTDSEGLSAPCPCVEDPDHPRCSPAYCHCDEAGCGANVRWSLARVDLDVDGDTMAGFWRAPFFGWAGTLRRVSP